MSVAADTLRNQRRSSDAASSGLTCQGPCRSRGDPGGGARPRTAAPVSRNGRPGHGSPTADDELQLIAPPAYFLAPCDLRVPDGGGIFKCPLPDHDDAYASCQVFAEAEQGWWCFGCARGGRIYDLASLMSGGAWGRELRGEAFLSARELVAAAIR